MHETSIGARFRRKVRFNEMGMNRNCEKCDFNRDCERKDPNNCPFDDPKIIFGEPIESNENKLIKVEDILADIIEMQLIVSTAVGDMTDDQLAIEEISKRIGNLANTYARLKDEPNVRWE